MFARAFMIAVLLVCCVAASAGSAAQPAGTLVVLKLPPTMPQAAVDRLIAELVAKGARPATPLPPTASAGDAATATAALVAVAPSDRPVATSAHLAGRNWRATRRAWRSLPLLLNAPQYWSRQLAVPADSAAGVSLRFWVAVVVLLGVPTLISRSMRRLLFARAAAPMPGRGLHPRLRAAIGKLAIATASLMMFAVALWAALLWASSGNRLLEETADRIVQAALQWRFAVILLVVVLSPERRDLRLLAIDDADARTCTRWIAVYAAASPLNFFLVWLTERLGFPQPAVFGAALVLGISVTGYKIAMFWAIRRPIGRAILAATVGEPPPLRRLAAALWHWFFIALSLAIFVAAGIAFGLGQGAWVAGAASMTQAIVVVLAVLWQAGHKLIDLLFAGSDGGADTAAAAIDRRRPRFGRVLHLLCDALLLIVGAAWLAETWGLALVNPPAGSVERLVLRPILLAAATVVGAWIVWLVLSAVIDERMPHAGGPGDEDEGIALTASRFATLMPLLRNMILIGIGLVALAAALSTLGINLAPLLAGLGVIGIALGFGAQTLVRDIISGVFFLMEDAFRIGEYIDTGRLRGTVEGMSLRSVRLRHQNGQVHTVPFGQVQAVTNFSRDWSVVKFNLHLEPSAELELVRKTIKRVGQELLQDPQIGAEFIQPLKMQGVIDVLQTALVVRCKFTAAPTRPSYLQRQALHRLMDAFAGAGIRFAAPNVMLQLANAAPAA